MIHIRLLKQKLQILGDFRFLASMNKQIPTVGIVVIKNKEVLLVRHEQGAEHLTGVYGLPGGRIKEGENTKEAASRELLEETGLQADGLIHLSHVFHANIPRKSGDILRVSWDIFVTNEVKGDIKTSSETTPEWIDIKEVSQLNLLPNTELAVKEGLKLIKL